MERREYSIKITVNDVAVCKVIIDAHYGQSFESDGEEGPYTYYVTDRMKLDDKFYKLVGLLEGDALYIGVINAYRRR